MSFISHLRRRWRLLVVITASIAGLMSGIFGVGTGLDHALQRQRWALRSHDASGEIHIVEIDARSIAAIAHWPWPRSTHGAAIDILDRAGAAVIAFDVDFSARSRGVEDRVFVAALERAGGGVVLPTFRQRSGTGRTEWIDSLPFPEARAHAVLAAVSVLPDSDGYIRQMPIGTTTDGTPRPSLSAMLADANGRADDSFSIDYAIDPESIPRHSFIDLLNGRVDMKALKGKRVLIGATAIELGDNYAVPRYGVIPGVVIQALAAETLRTGRTTQFHWLPPLIVALAMAAGLVRLRSGPALTYAFCGALGFFFIVSLAAEQWLRTNLPLAPTFVVVAFAIFGAAIAKAAGEVERLQLTDADSGLPNKAAMLRWLDANPCEAVVVAHVAAYERLAAALGADQMGETIRRLHDRVALTVDGAPVFRIDEAALAWPSTTAQRDVLCEQLAALRTMMLNSLEVQGRRVDVTLHFGIAENRHEASAQLVALGLAATERARSSPSGWHVHGLSDNVQLEREVSLLGELDDAVRQDGLSVVYQPKLDIRSGRVVSTEALVRWQHPVRGALGPDSFIPLAEQNDRILPLTSFVMKKALRDCAEWRAKGLSMSVAVNISSMLVASADFFTIVEELVVDPAFVRGCLIFEVTESAPLSDAEGAVRALQAFRSMGISISMDDYGTGQSTLSQLQQLPVDELKIDRRFVQHAHVRRADAVLVRSTIEMAHQLGMKVVAEGVEDQPCLDFLVSVGCDTAQGYLIGKPVAPNVLATQLIASELRAA